MWRDTSHASLACVHSFLASFHGTCRSESTVKLDRCLRARRRAIDSNDGEPLPSL